MGNERLDEFSIELTMKAGRVRFLLLDVDGVLTDGGLYYGPAGAEFKRFDVKDGAGIHLAMSHGLEVGILTGKSSEVVSARARELGISRVVQGAVDKRIGLKKLLEDGEYTMDEIGYVGDDVLDLPVFKRVLFTACPADAHPMVRARADLVCRNIGGHGVVREVIDFILTERGCMDAVEREYWEE